MAKKRGGLAGFYDKNKKVIKPVAAGLAGMLGTPALGAAVGAAFGGLDREGKKGIGVDLGGAVKGGLSGYAAGGAGQALGRMAGIGKVGALERAGEGLSGGLKNLLTGGKSAASGAEVPSILPRSSQALPSSPEMGGFRPDMSGVSASTREIASSTKPDLTGYIKATQGSPSPAIGSFRPDMSGASVSPMSIASKTPQEGGAGMMDLLKGAGRGAGRAANKLGGFVERNKAISELGVKGLLSQLPSEESAINRQRLDLDERKFAMTEQQMEEERERRMFVNQYLRRQYPQFFQNG